jgi:endonuclease YncB( thermonuclease family)
MARDDPTELPFRKFLRRSGAQGTARWARRLLLVLCGVALAFGLLLAGRMLRETGGFSAGPVASAGRAPPEVVTPPPPAVEPAPPPPPAAPAPTRTRFVKPVRFEPPYEPIDARRFRAGDTTIVLTGIDAPERMTLCEDFSKARWICGIQARAALYYLIRAETLTCLEAENQPVTEKHLAGTCTFGARDVATELVRSGYARPMGVAPGPAMLKAEDEARMALRGLWDGNWTLAPR